MESLSTIQHHHRCQQPLNLSLHPNRPSFTKPISSISFKSLPLSHFTKPSSSSSSSSSRFRVCSIRASHSSSPSSPLSENPKNPKPLFSETLKPFPYSLLRTSCVAAVTVAALFFSRLTHKPLPVIAAPIAPPSTAETAEQSADGVSEDEKERILEENLNSNPGDVQALRSLMESKIKNRKLEEAIGILDRLIGIEPEESEWPLLKSHLYSYSGESELAKAGFEEVLTKDPLRVEAYHGLVMAVSQSESSSGEELTDVLKRIENAMENCKKEKKKEDLRDFKLLIAQIKVIEGNYNDALKVYQELVKEEPRDFRPYLCQGIIYTLLRKKDEAEKQFQKYRRLVPKEHPYAQYFDDNMLATKVFSQKVENESAGSRF